jgi:hypothetical protein
MDVKSAVSEAKKWLADVMAEERIANIRLEEVEFDDSEESWLITLGFFRPMHKSGKRGLVPDFSDVVNPHMGRVYRVIKVKEPDGKVISMKRPSSLEA